MRIIRYRQIAEAVRNRIDAGELEPGQLLPSEAALTREFEVSRVTVRRALDSLKDDGLVEPKQGYGWVVAAPTFAQSLETLVTIERQLADSGRRSERNILDFGFEPAPESVAAVLGPTVLTVRRVNLADDRPIARVTVWCREDLGANLSRADVTRASFYELLPGVAARATQTIGSELMSADDAELLDVAPSSAALVVRRTTYDGRGRPALMSEHAFPGHRTEFVAELSAATGLTGSTGEGPGGEAGDGFRLVEGG